MRRLTLLPAAVLAAALVPLPAVAAPATAASVADHSDVQAAPTFPTATGDTWVTSDPVDVPADVLLAAADWGVEPGHELADGHGHGRVQIRTLTDGSWDAWADVHPAHELPDAGTEGGQSTWSEPIGITGATEVQWRLADVSADELTVMYLTEDGAPDPARTARTTAAATATGDRQPPAMPDVITRAEWGANEGYHNGRINHTLQLRFGVVHHTAHSASANSYSESQADDLIRSIYRYHTLSRGYNDIAYNFIVDRYGNIYEGRKGGMDRAVQSAATGGFNSGSVSVAVLGNFDQGHLPSSGMTAIERLLAWKFDVHHVDPHGTTEEVAGSSANHWPRGTTVTLPTIIGHTDTKSTSCPGATLHEPVANGELAAAVDSIGGPKMYGTTSHTRWRGYATGQDIVTDVTTSEPLEWTTTVTNASGTVVSEESGTGESFQMAWDLKDDDGTWAPEGRYVLRTEGVAVSDGAEARPFVVPVVIQPSEHSYDDKVDTTVLARHVDVPLPDSFDEATMAIRWPDGKVRRTIDEPTVPSQGSSTDDGGTAVLRWDLTDADGNRVDEGTYIAETTIDGDTERIGVVVDDAVDRLSGPERHATASAVALRHFDPADTDTVVLASGRSYPDALVAGPLADQLDAPILLTEEHTLPEPTATALRILDPDDIVIVGGPAVITGEVESAAATAAGVTAADVTRIAGADRYETAMAVHEHLAGISEVTTSLIASGENFPDALSAAAAAAELDGSVLLTPRQAAPDGLADTVADLADVHIVGGPAAITADTAETIGVDSRVAGAGRFETALAVAALLPAPPEGTEVYLASGLEFPDALATSAAMGTPDRRLMLAAPGHLPGVVADAISAIDGLRQVVIVGGPAALSYDTGTAAKTAALDSRR